MSKFLKHLLPDNHSSRLVIEVLDSMELIEWVKGMCAAALAMTILPMMILLWEIRDVIV